MFNMDVYKKLSLKYVKECKENLNKKDIKKGIKNIFSENKEECLNELRDYLNKCDMHMPPYKFYYSYNDKSTWKYKDHRIKHLQILDVKEINNPDYKYKIRNL